ncbi:MAG: hypothetical protein NTW52_15150 [Planctomycetota bacterium]|nr:hypothetical protein [Planctomycetota bacterium]
MKKHLLITPAQVPPFRDDLKVIGAFNPGATIVNGRLVLIVRVAVTTTEERPGHFAWLRFLEGHLEIEWLRCDLFDCDDTRVMRRLSDGRVFLSSVSYFQLMWVDNYCDRPEEWRLELGDTILPSSAYETYGIEDARCQWIDGCCFVTYTSVSAHGACTSLITTNDFCTFEHHGVIFVCENKDVVLFPDRVDGKILALHRPVSATKFCSPEIWLASSIDGLAWGNHQFLLSGSSVFESDRIGASTPPVRFDDRYLVLYHASEQAQRPSSVGRYVAGLITMNIVDYGVHLLQKSTGPFLIPTESWELAGFVANVVFPTAMLQSQLPKDDSWLVFYGAADCNVGVVTISSMELRKGL